jgi:hypothetical protein
MRARAHTHLCCATLGFVGKYCVGTVWGWVRTVALATSPAGAPSLPSLGSWGQHLIRASRGQRGRGAIKAALANCCLRSAWSSPLHVPVLIGAEDLVGDGRRAY